MGIFGPKLQTMHDLFVYELQSVYGAEQTVIDALPKMIDAASTPNLKDHFQRHLEQKQEQLELLEDCFDMLDMAPESQPCFGVEGIIRDGNKLISAKGVPEVLDAGLITVAQKLEHEDIAAYGTLRSMAETLGYTDIAQKLQGILTQEKTDDKLLTDVAVTEVNVGAPQK